ncbi:MAG: dUTP diphosphatase [Candidatus Eremiobacteraeota bacterium]|nr:dUTP diphosphatase [Candidatus Eremiobacteraeota bacterium]
MAQPLAVQLRITAEGVGLPLPAYMTDGAAGCDLLAAISEDRIIAVGARTLLSAGFCIGLPRGYEAQIRPRSGLALDHGITCLNSPGTIDSDYRGTVSVLLVNLGGEQYTVHRGDRIAQMVVARVERACLHAVPELDDTVRSRGGFGSTGSRPRPL